jgi:Ti-type conjugative transfer relaxase TraA
MLSIGRMGAGAEEYYIRTVANGREEYYTGSGESPGQWCGRGAAALGLSGEVSPEHLRAVLAGVSPDGRSLTAGGVKPGDRVTGFDLTWSAPKSVSLLWGLSDPGISESVRNAHERAVADALGYIEEHGLRVRRGKGGERRINAGGLIAAAFVHRTSRNGDPQLHTHLLVANAACGADGSWSAPDSRLLYFHARTAGFLYQAALRAELTDTLGVRFGPVTNGAAELTGVPPLLLKAFSTRRAEIERYLAANGGSNRRAGEVAALATRQSKEPVHLVVGDEADASSAVPIGIRERWRDRASDLDIADPTMADQLGRHHRTPVTDDEAEALIAHLAGPDGLTAQDSTFERRDVMRSVAASLPDGAPVAEVSAVADRLLTSPAIVALPTVGRGGELRHTTLELLGIETTLLSDATARRNSGVAVVDQPNVEGALENFSFLSDEQLAMVRRLTTSGAGVEIVIGKAGTGKTAALAAARVAWESAGYQVRGTAVSARAAEGLHDGAGISSTTLAKLEFELENGSVSLGRHDVVVVDEAGMVGTRQLGRLLGHASTGGARVVLVGDSRQLPEIEAGGVFAELAERLGASELTVNRRQRDGWERAALDQLRHGDPELAVNAFDTAQRIHTAPSMADARRQMVDAWLPTQRASEDTVMLAVNRRDIVALNDDARAALRRHELLGPDVVVIGEAGLAIGDQVVCLRNNRALGVLNGTKGTVESADHKGVTLDTEQGRRLLPATYVEDGHLAHGYAVTVHKAQGATVDRAFVLATDSLTREAGYVAMSRARSGTELFVPTSAFEDGIVRTGTDSPGHDPLEGVTRRLLVSRAKQIATAELGTRSVHHSSSAMPHGRGLDSGTGRDPLRIPQAVEELRDRQLDRTSSAPTTKSPVRDPTARYLEPVMGRRPEFTDERLEYDLVAGQISTYRERFDVQGDDALGPRPFEAIRRANYDMVLTELRRYEQRLGREHHFPDRSIGMEL